MHAKEIAMKKTCSCLCMTERGEMEHEHSVSTCLLLLRGVEELVNAAERLRKRPTAHPPPLPWK